MTRSEDHPSCLRLAGPLGLNLTEPTRLGDEIFRDLDDAVYGIGWWKSHHDLDRQTRILLSDYLIACARAVPENLIEAQVECFELDHAIQDFRAWMSRLADPNEPSAAGAPQNPYEELSSHRVRTHLAGALRGWGSALDCVGGCIVGVTGLPSNLVKADLATALRDLRKHSPNNEMLKQLHIDLEQAEAATGPQGWREWLLGMRNTYVHRGRRTITWNVETDGNEVTGFSIRLPIQPDLTDVDAIVQAQGVLASNFTVSSTEMLQQLSKTMGSYVSAACSFLTELWLLRRANPSLLEQSPRQWRQPAGLITPSTFRGFPNVARSDAPAASMTISPEGERRLRAAALLSAGNADRMPNAT